MSDDWKFNPIEPIQSLADVLGDSSPDWSSREELEQIRYTTHNLNRDLAAGIGMTQVKPLIEAYGDALTFQFLLGEQIVLNIDRETDHEVLEQFRQKTEGSKLIGFNFRIDKSRLAIQWFGNIFNQSEFQDHLVLYLFPDKCEQVISRSTLTQLEQRLWNNHRDERIVILVPGRDVFINGYHLIILGGKYLQNPSDELFKNKMIAQEEQNRVLSECQDSLKWQTPINIALTPWHIYTFTDCCYDDPIGSALRIHFASLFLMYTADRTITQTTTKGDLKLQSSYNTSQQTIEIVLPQADQVDTSNIHQSSFAELLSIFEWAYDENWNSEDRLTIVQLTIVDALRGSDTSQRYKLLLENASAILENINWHWKAFAEEKIDGYWDQVRELEKYVDETIKSYSEQISAIVSKLTETVLAAVGVLLGSFIASLFQEKFNPIVFRIGLITYVFYVLFFPLIYNMKSQWGNYHMVIKDFEARKRRFEKRLPKDKVREIIQDSLLDENKLRFENWFRYSVIIYIVLIILAIGAAIFIPGVFGSQTAISIPSATDVVTPSLISITQTPTP